MPMQLAQPTFLTGPNDKLATVDVYTQQSNTVINNRPDTWSMSSLGGAASLLGGKGMLASLPLGGGVQGILSAGISGLTSTLGVTNPALAKAVKALTPLATREIEKRLPANINNIIASVGSVSRIVDIAKSGNVMGVVNAVNGIAQSVGVPGIKMTDPQGLIALSSGLVAQGIQSGVPGVLTTLKTSNVIQGNAAMNAVVKNVMPAVIQKGDLGALKEITMVAPSSLVSLNDNTIGEFCKAYPDPTAPKTPGQYTAEFGDIKNSFQTINADWLTAKADVEGDSINMASIMSGAPEFKKTIAVGALNSTDPEDKWLLAASARSDAEFKLLSEGSTIDGYTDAQIKAMGGVLPANGSKDAITPMQRAATLYPATATMGNATTAPVDARAVEESKRVDAIQKKLNTFTLPSRTEEELKREMDQEETRWADRISEEINPLFNAANAAKLAGDMELYNAKTAEYRAAETSMRVYFEARIKRIQKDLDKWAEYRALERTKG